MLAALAAGIWLAALNVKYRDVKYIVPFFITIGVYISPVAFVSDLVPEKWRFWYSMNPMVGVIDGFRWSLFGPGFEPYWPGFWLGSGLTFLVLGTGALYFRRTEKTFADVI
jgi:lipopolysaccharide transport system permease protein